jgi:hypothetical protein
MSQLFEIDLEWPVASRYVMGAAKEPRGDRAIFVADGATLTLRRPFDENPTLFAEFAALDGSEQSCLQFAHKYGTLMADPRNDILDPGLLESLRLWRERIKYIQDIIQYCKLARDRPAEAFRQFGKQDIELSGGLTAYLSTVRRTAPPTLTIRCKSFSGALDLQAVQSILDGREVYKCIECSKLFEVGAGGRRSQSKFCSIRCKDTFHNRSKAEARRGRHA